MKDQRRFAPEGGRIDSESVAGFVGISNKITCILRISFVYGLLRAL